MGELDAHVGVVSSFGAHGLASLGPIGLDAGLHRVVSGPNRQILVLVGGGNMGCWWTEVTALSASGAPEQRFDGNFAAAMGQVMPSGAFIGDLVVRAHDFLVVGTSERGCDDWEKPNATAMGRVVAFRPDGKLESSFALAGRARFRSRMAGTVWALPEQDGDILVAMSPVHANDLQLVELRPDGTVNHLYGTQGHAELQFPGDDSSPDGEVDPVGTATNGQAAVLAATDRNSAYLLELSA